MIKKYSLTSYLRNTNFSIILASQIFIGYIKILTKQVRIIIIINAIHTKFAGNHYIGQINFQTSCQKYILAHGYGGRGLERQKSEQ
jgi:sulfur transfer complex TusBCD TusB component (DsrH family)